MLELTHANDGELVVGLDLVLETAELALLGPVVEGYHENHYNDRHEDSCSLDPTRLTLRLVVARGVDVCVTKTGRTTISNNVNMAVLKREGWS